MSVTFSIRVADDVYVYVRGRLVYKRWLRTGVSATFHVAPSWVEWRLGEAPSYSDAPVEQWWSKP